MAAKLEIANRENVVNGTVTSMFFTRVETKSHNGPTRYSVKIDSLEITNPQGSGRYYIDTSIPLSLQFPAMYEKAVILHLDVKLRSDDAPGFSRLYHALIKDIRPGDIVSLAIARTAGNPERARQMNYTLKQLYHIIGVNREAVTNVDNAYKELDFDARVTILGNAKCAERIPVFVGKDWHIGEFAILKSNAHIMWNPGTRMIMGLCGLTLAESSGGAHTSDSGQSNDLTSEEEDRLMNSSDYDKSSYKVPTLEPNQQMNSVIAADSMAAIGQPS